MAESKAIRDVRRVGPARPRKHQEEYDTVIEAIALAVRKHAVKAIKPERLGSVNAWQSLMAKEARNQGWKLHYNTTDPDLAENEAWVWVTKK